jgi:hypothetical protein
MSAGVFQYKYPALRDLSPGAQAAAAWFRRLARALNSCLLYSTDNPVLAQARQQLHERLLGLISAHGAWRLRITPNELWLQDEPIIHPTVKNDPDAVPEKFEQLPFVFYRDGIRKLTFLPDIPAQDFQAFFDGLVAVGSGPMPQDDLVTLLWQANPQRLLFEAVPVHQTIYLSSKHAPSGGGTEARSGLAYDWSPTGEEIHADIGQVVGMAQGLHLDTFDDWPLPTTFVDVPTAYTHLSRGMEFMRSVLVNEWVAERGTHWTTDVPAFFRRVSALDPGMEMRQALVQSAITWVAGATQNCIWAEAQQALALLREFDPDGSLGSELLASAIAGLDAEAIARRLDESEVGEQSAFFAFAVSLGRPALDLGVSILRVAEKARTRAAACTMLCYICGDEPGLLANYLTDSRWYVVRNTVFVLGQIGGPAVVDLLELAAQHPDARVRRQVVQSLGNVPAESRVPILTHQLQSEDLRLLAATLAMLARHRGRDTTRALVHQIQAPDFETRSTEHQRMMFNAVAELCDDAAVPGLASLLSRGGWFARRTAQRQAAAQTLRRIGTEKALKALEEGIRSGNDVVKATCLEALSDMGKP